MFDDVANVKLSTYAKELGLASCVALILSGITIACDKSKEIKATSAEKVSAKKVGTHVSCPKCGARIPCVVNER